MIVSHKHKFIFVKNRKVAGTSVEMALAAICGPDDILSSDTPERVRTSDSDELMAHARNYEGGFNVLREIAMDPRPMSSARVLRDRFRRHRFYNHMRAVSIRARLPKGMWEDYYTFCFERNPWDKMVSFHYWYHRHYETPPQIDAFITGAGDTSTEDRRFPTDWERYTMGDRIIVDDVFDYGDLDGNLRRALTNAGVPQVEIDRVYLPNSKSHTRKKRTPEPLSDASDAVIRRVFHREIEAFGYTRPDISVT